MLLAASESAHDMGILTEALPAVLLASDKAQTRGDYVCSDCAGRGNAVVDSAVLVPSRSGGLPRGVAAGQSIVTARGSHHGEVLWTPGGGYGKSIVDGRAFHLGLIPGLAGGLLFSPVPADPKGWPSHPDPRPWGEVFPTESFADPINLPLPSGADGKDR